MNILRSVFPAKISLLHATRGRPGQALEARERWLDLAARPGRIEHIFAVDCDDEASVKALAKMPHRIVPDKGGGCVAAWNIAAEASTGDVLVQLSDDWTPTRDWDDEFVSRLRDVAQPGVLRPSDGRRRDDLLCMAILTRARLRQQGDLLHHGYLGIYSDDEFSFRAYQDGVVIDARDLVLLHDHPNYNPDVPVDETYLNQNCAERDKQGRKLFLKRNPRAKGHWLHEGDWRRFFVPLAAGEDWQDKPAVPPARLKTMPSEEVPPQGESEASATRAAVPRPSSGPPRVAIITRTLDRPVLLERAMHSILAQTFANWHWIVVDSSTSGGASSFVQSHAERLRDRVTHVQLRNPKPGMRGAAINAGISASESELITLLDDDDTWELRFLEKMVAALDRETHPNVRGAVCRTRCIEESSVESGLQMERTYDLNPDLCNVTLGSLAVVNRFCTHAFLYRRDALKTVGLYPEDYPVLEDWHFNLRFVRHHDIVVVPEILTNYHFRPPEQRGAPANSQTAERDDHKFHEARLINEALREDLRTGTQGLGFVLTQASIAREISDALHRHENRLKSIGDKTGKIDSRTRELKDKLLRKR